MSTIARIIHQLAIQAVWNALTKSEANGIGHADPTPAGRLTGNWTTSRYQSEKMKSSEKRDPMARTARRVDPHHVRIAREIGISIVTGQVTPGTMLPNETAIAHERGVSRTVIREALRMLSAKRLIQSRPGVGTRVRERSDWSLLDPELMGWMSVAEPTYAFVDALMQLCAIVEPAAAELAASGRSARQLSLLGHALEQMATYGLAHQIGKQANQLFHQIIFEATRNDLLVSLSTSINAATRWTRQFKNNRAHEDISIYREIFQAIASADPCAARIAAANLIGQAQARPEIVRNMVS